MSIKISTSYLGSVCMLMHLEAENEIEAVDKERQGLYKVMQLKELAGIDTTEDRELYEVLRTAREDLIYEKFREQLGRKGVQHD